MVETEMAGDPHHRSGKIIGVARRIYQVHQLERHRTHLHRAAPRPRAAFQATGDPPAVLFFIVARLSGFSPRLRGCCMSPEGYHIHNFEETTYLARTAATSHRADILARQWRD
ncbi:hypothetical protein [Sphingomonas sp. PB1R3]|uniref:hypothetical protein n=1 Tax=Sphingomonas flavida TaxID=3096154 RepID=UPI002FC92E64